MSQKILITNIGMRNLIFSNDQEKWTDIDEYINSENLSQYQLYNNTLNKQVSNLNAFSKDLLEQTIKVAYQLNILTPSLIEQESPDAIMLFSTLQSSGNHQYQDTYYCGELIKQEIEKVTDVPVYNFKIDTNPSSEDALFPIYAQYFRELKNHFSENIQFVFLDAGGTTQMKAVIKTLLEYYFKAKARIIYQSISKKHAEVPDRDYHKHYSFLSLAENFIKEFNYDAAYKVVSNLKIEQDDHLTQLKKHIDICRKRITFDYRNVRGLYINDQIVHALFRNYLLQQPLAEANALSAFNKRSQHDILEIASIVDLFFSLKNYTLGVATYYRLVEEIGQSFVEVKFGLTFPSGDKKRRGELAIKLKKELGTDASKYNDELNVPLMVAAMLKTTQYPKVKRMAEIMAPSISTVNGQPGKGLNILRNQCYLAHSNQAITKGVISTTCKTFFSADGVWEKLKKELNLPNENIYWQMNKVLFNLLYQL